MGRVTGVARDVDSVVDSKADACKMGGCGWSAAAGREKSVEKQRVAVGEAVGEAGLVAGVAEAA